MGNQEYFPCTVQPLLLDSFKSWTWISPASGFNLGLWRVPVLWVVQAETVASTPDTPAHFVSKGGCSLV